MTHPLSVSLRQVAGKEDGRVRYNTGCVVSFMSCCQRGNLNLACKHIILALSHSEESLCRRKPDLFSPDTNENVASQVCLQRLRHLRPSLWAKICDAKTFCCNLP